MTRHLCAIALSLSLLTPFVAEAQGVAGSYLAGRQAQYENDFAAIGEYYADALRRDSSNPRMVEAALIAFVNQGDMARAITLANRFNLTGAQNQVSNIVYTAEQAASGNFARLAEDLTAGREIGPLVDGLLLGWAALGEGDVTGAMEQFDTVSQQQGLGGFANYHKALATAVVGDFEGALALFGPETAGSLANTRRSVMMRAEMLSQLDRNTDAIELLETAFDGDLDPGLRDLRMKLADGQMVPFTGVTSAQDGLAEVFFTVAAALRNETSPDYTLLYARTADYIRSDFVDAVIMSAQLLEELENYPLAVAAYDRVPRDHLSFHAAEIGRAEALYSGGNPDAAIEVMQQLMETHGDIAVVHSTLGDIFRREERYDDASQAYDRALDLTPSDDPNAWFLHYARGITHEREDRWFKAEEDFRKALELRPGQPSVLNYLGYSLVEKDMKLDEALEMIEQAAEARPDSGYILDSLGWVFYRLGRYQEAVEPMEKAAALMPVDPIVNDHLGDVLWAVGRQTEARFQWSRALSFDPEEDDAERIRRKLEVGLDIVLEEEGEPPLPKADQDG
ncbi:tetratricopeptide repeat protein [Nereida sp. MMG025]|uniref:tetratricopeptide repeat protein n=1 Tax=Nereida sp. MMG025 TaxID=2909981 RepID=UPI001F39EAE2|nr:tetratricopeptide repeat protein [Nereida sp. MMG025]MCF6444363.1 tetratricopeptide repeat protein [Nereida sp. MMG025]